MSDSSSDYSDSEYEYEEEDITSDQPEWVTDPKKELQVAELRDVLNEEWHLINRLHELHHGIETSFEEFIDDLINSGKL
jgi:hypothetical protein